VRVQFCNSSSSWSGLPVPLAVALGALVAEGACFALPVRLFGMCVCVCVCVCACSVRVCVEMRESACFALPVRLFGMCVCVCVCVCVCLSGCSVAVHAKIEYGICSLLQNGTLISAAYCPSACSVAVHTNIERRKCSL